MLRLEDVTKRFGGLTAVDSLSFSVDEGEIVGLIGPNGAGKSTTFNLITGALSLSDGSIYYREQRIDDLPTYERISLGIGRTYQTPHPFSELTISENIQAATLPNTLSTIRMRNRNGEKVEDIAKLVHLEGRLDVYPSELTPGELRRLEIARALASEPDLLLLDEVFAGITNEEATELAKLIEELRNDAGYTFLVVDHVMSILMPLVDRTIVMSGKKIAEGNPQSIVENEEVQKVYLGTESDLAGVHS